uniref:ADP,ATP carrier protein n=1 Tax=Heterorhabditis bacteriophora TaxID=37862 RepID=A0A1I7XB37_HETBA
MLAGGLAGMFQIIVTTPMELLKIQMQNQGRTNENGIAGLYKGLSSTFARDVTFSMIYFPFFAYLDSLGPRKGDGSGDAVFWTSFAAGLLAGASSSFAVTPLDGSSIFQTNKKILKMEGPRALFKGAACRMMVMAPLFGIAQTVYYVGVAEKILGIEKGVHI